MNAYEHAVIFVVAKLCMSVAILMNYRLLKCAIFIPESQMCIKRFIINGTSMLWQCECEIVSRGSFVILTIYKGQFVNIT